jgi:CRISPR-associated protein Csd2
MTTMTADTDTRNRDDEKIDLAAILYSEVPEVLLDPTKRHDCLFIFDVENGNPNGDPDNENAPRMEGSQGYGIVTDGCIKSKMRRFFHEYGGYPLYIQPKTPLNNLIRDAIVEAGGKLAEIDLSGIEDARLDEVLAHAAEVEGFVVEGSRLIYTGAEAKSAGIQKALLAGLDKDSTTAKAIKDLKLSQKLETVLNDKKGGNGIDAAVRDAAEQAMVRKYIDVRLFGAVMSTGLNAGQRRGPVQVVTASSKDPITPIELAITRQAKTNQERLDKSRTEIGRRSMLTYALYQGHMFYNASLGIKSGVTRDDMRVMWEAMMRMFALDHAAGRAMLRMRGVYVWTHSDKFGCAPYDRLFKLIDVDRVSQVDARCFDDYRITVRELPENDKIAFTRLIG